MTIESELKDIKKQIIEISKKLDDFLSNRELKAMMKLSELSMNGFLESEPDIYSFEDLKEIYHSGNNSG